MFGKVFINEDFNSVILFIHSKNFNFKRLLLEVQLVLRVIGIKNIYKVLKRERVLKMNHSNSDYVHLWLMGTKPSFQGRGQGTILLKQALEHYTGRTVILETTALDNLNFYQKSGFQIFEENHVLNYPLYFMRYD
nr:GNAT family N-acetyltransferase [Chryseobacterium pyrolae]